jgi:D-glycero-alpha-D-manno-heptose-7-phosphate kinase
LRVCSKAPLRISFAGGGTDVPPYPELHGGAVISSTIDRYAYVSLEPRKDEKVVIRSLDFDIVSILDSIAEIRYDGNLDFAKAVIRTMGKPAEGLNIHISCNAPPGSGLGSSSALIVGVVGAMKHLHDQALTSYEIADTAYRIEREELKIQGGMQDQYSATFGGLNFIEFKADHVVVNPLRIRAEILNELSSHLVLCNTGKTRLSSRILSRQIRSYESRDPLVMDSLDGLKRLASEMKDALLRGRVDRLGPLLDLDWKLKRQLDKKVSNPRLDKIYAMARASEATGGKILGAGGGGYFLFYCEPEGRPKLEATLKRGGCSLERFSFETNGLQTWKVGERGVVF